MNMVIIWIEQVVKRMLDFIKMILIRIQTITLNFLLSNDGFLLKFLFKMDNLNITKLDKGMAKCPFNPHANITTLLTENGKLFIASPTDFSGTDPAVLRTDISQV